MNQSHATMILTKGNWVDNKIFHQLRPIASLRCRKAMKNDNIMTYVQPYEDRYLFLINFGENDTRLVVLKMVVTLKQQPIEAPKGSDRKEEGATNPYAKAQQLAMLQSQTQSEEHLGWQIKSITELNRLFMIDISYRNQVVEPSELFLHFVNQQKLPGGFPDIKRYSIGKEFCGQIDQTRFLKELHRCVNKESKYYSKAKK